MGVRGLVRLESEPKAISFDDVESAWCPGLRGARSVVAVLPEDAEASEALFLPLRLALTGVDHGPDMASLLPLIGAAEAQARLTRAGG